MPPAKIVLVVEYDGTNYCGSQLQAGEPTIQEELEKAIRRLTGESIRIVAASRTDSGVHARGQVVSFRTVSRLAPEVFVRALNHYLPDDIAVREGYRVGDPFHVQRNALSREYRYRILNSFIRSVFWQRFAYRVAGKLDVAAMKEAGRNLLGQHDFASFASDIVPGKPTTRTVYRAEVERQGEMVVFDMVASSFLTHQVRNTVGTLIRVGQGKVTVAEFGGLVETRQPGTAGPCAPARGLCLVKVNYPRPLGEEAI